VTPANVLREALARVVADQRRDADEIVNDIYAVLREYGRVGWEVRWDDGVAYGEHYVQFNPNNDFPAVLVLPLPDKDPS
jgi:hypothetical protein